MATGNGTGKGGGNGKALSRAEEREQLRDQIRKAREKVFKLERDAADVLMVNPPRKKKQSGYAPSGTTAPGFAERRAKFQDLQLQLRKAQRDEMALRFRLTGLRSGR